MKKLKVFAILTLVIMLFAIPNAVFAYDDYCYETEDGWHDYTYHTSMRVSHPHKGYRQCMCGDRVYLEYRYDDECEICQEELCQEGVHYYLYDIQYLDEYGYTGYARCYCGRKKYFSFDDYRLEDEPYEGFITFAGDIHSVIHPHYAYDIDRNRYDYDDTMHAGACGVCELEDQYYRDVEEYEIDTFIYGDSYYDDRYYYEDEEYDDFDEWYYNDEDYYLDEDYYEEDYYSWEDEEYDSYYEEDEFYEWLELAHEILNE